MPDMRVITRPHTNSTKLFTEVPAKREDAGNPDSHKNSLTLVILSPGKKPNTDAEEETQKRRRDEEILAFHFFSLGLKSNIKHSDPTGIRSLVDGTKTRCPRPRDDGADHTPAPTLAGSISEGIFDAVWRIFFPELNGFRRSPSNGSHATARPDSATKAAISGVAHKYAQAKSTESV